jgi:hypothetical protein
MNVFFERESKKDRVVMPASVESWKLEEIANEVKNEAPTQTQEAEIAEKEYREFEKLLCKEVGIIVKEEEEEGGGIGTVDR